MPLLNITLTELAVNTHGATRHMAGNKHSVIKCVSMAETKVNVKRLVDTIGKTNVYTSIVEAVANSIDSIHENNPTNAEIVVTLHRSAQLPIGQLADDALQPFVRVTISDNGIGFIDKNFNAFNEIYTDMKIREGGKGFGRFVFLKYFEDVTVESVYKDRGGFVRRTFCFVTDNPIIQDDLTGATEAKTVETVVTLDGLKSTYMRQLDKTVDTVARKLLEKLLVHFVIDDYKCPRIIVRDGEKKTEVVLNELIGADKEVVPFGTKTFMLASEDESIRKDFKAKIFKIFYSQGRSGINLVADKRLVTDEALYKYIPEFRDDFYDTFADEKGTEHKKSFIIQTYVEGTYLDENVSLERGEFAFSNTDNKEMFHPFTRIDIEREAANVTRDAFPDDIKTRREKKEAEIREYVENDAPWHKGNLGDLDFASIPYNPTDLAIDEALERVRFQKERKVREDVKKILEKTDNEKQIAEAVNEIVARVDDVQKTELAHYVALRKTIIDIFKKSLEWDDSKKHEKEEVVHKIIFPLKATSDDTAYEDHNLWLLDERLSYSLYVASDKPLNTNDERPDLLVFDNRIVMREGDEASNPIVIFELKRPQRNDYDGDDNPLQQIADYVEKIRKGDYINPKGRPIVANANTPAYGYLACDITPKIDAFCKAFSLTKSPDGQGYFGFHTGYRIYFEVVSFDKIVKDSKQRNKIFFKKLGIA